MKISFKLHKAHYDKSRSVKLGLLKSNIGLLVSADIHGSYDSNVVPRLVIQARNNGFVDNPVVIIHYTGKERNYK